MQTCQNCGSQLSCGCQKRIATDGTNVCSSCIAQYEQKLIELRSSQNNNQEENKTNT